MIRINLVGINLVGIPKFQHPWRTLLVSKNSGTWGNRGKGNELQSALEKGLSWIGDKVMNADDYINDGFNYLFTVPLAAVTGKTKEIPRVINLMRELRHNRSLHYAMNPVFDLVSPIKGGWMLKGLMKGSPLEKQLSKAGTININGLLAYLNKASKLELDVIGKVLNNQFTGLKNIDYNDLRKAVNKELITYSRIPASEYEDYGFTSLGFDAKHPVLFNTYTFASDKIPYGSAKHFYANTLGHSRTFILPEEPNILYVMESQSDWALKRIKRSIEELLGRKNRTLQSIDDLIAAANNPKAMKYEVEQINNELLPPLYTRLSGIQSDIDRLNKSDLQKIHLIENYPYRQIQENMKFASEKGNSLMRYPTRESAIKIEGYIPEKMPDNIYKEWSDEVLQYAKTVPNSPYTPQIYKILEKIKNTSNKEEINKLLGLLKKAKSIELRWFNGETTYPLKYESILEKYADFPKMFNKLFKELKVRTVTDSKGNTWYEVDVPENFLQSEWLFKYGGKLGINKIIGL